MSDKGISGISAGITAVIGLIGLVWWMTFDPTKNIVESRPGMDNSPLSTDAVAAEELVTIGEFNETYDGIAADLPGAWPRFRGANFDNISTQKTQLADRWPENGPEVLWSVELGEGHAAPAIRKGRVYLLDYDEEQKADALRCFSLADGKEIWRRWYHVRVKRNHGISRTVPAVTDRYVITIGPLCHVMCVNAETGDFLWGLDLARDFGTENPFWYTGQCPLIDDSVAVIAPAGHVLMMGVDCGTGAVLWNTPNPNNWQMSHSSIMPMTLDGRRMYVYCALGGIVGVAADGKERGTVLWQTPDWNHSVIAPSPVIFPDGRIFVTAGYGVGSAMLQIIKENGMYIVNKLQEYRPAEGLASEQQTPLHYREHLFSIQPKDAGALRNQFVCYHPNDCTQPVWTSGKTNRFGMGPYLVADDKIFVLNDDGVLTLLQASSRAYLQLAQARSLDGRDAWGPMAIADGRLLLRDSRRMVCLDVRKK